MARYTPSYFPVAWKIGLTIAFLVLVSMALLSSIITRNQSQRMQQQADTFGRAIAQQLADSAREPLLAQDSFTLRILVNNLTGENGLEGAAIFDHNGKLLQKAGHLPTLPAKPATQSRHEWQLAGQSYASYTLPIMVKDLLAGYVSVSVSQQAIIEAQQQAQKTLLTAMLLMAALIILASFLVARWLARPIQDLVTAAHAISSGDFHFRLHERRNDELGQLIDSYNKMATGLLEKDQVEKVLSRFVSPSVANKMIADIDQVRLGGRDMQASIIFADIVGFTSLSEGMPPEQLAQLLNSYFNAISCATRFYHGTIDKYVGDCAMIVFGAPEEDGQHFYHSLCCAHMIRLLVERLNQWREQHHLLSVDFRIGINSGPVLAGNLGSNERMQYTVIGDTVNLASRLSNLAGANDIILPQRLTQQADISQQFSFHSNGKINIRGKSQQVTTANLVGLHQDIQAPMEARIEQFMQQLEPPGLHEVQPR